MTLPTPPFDRVVVDEEVSSAPFTLNLLGRIPTEMAVHSRVSGDPLPKGRTTLHITRESGSFLKKCPCTPGVLRCGYRVFTLGFQCPFGCTYCFLRFYAPDEPLTLYANLEDGAKEFETEARTWQKPVRVGTGEFTDSLALEPWTGHAGFIANLIRKYPNALMELKTKSALIEPVLAVDPPPNLLVAWSVNPQSRIDSDELLTASLSARLQAAKSAADAGMKVAFHFDPIFIEGDWQKDYGEVVEAIFDHVAPEMVAWISLGTLRFPKRFLDKWGTRLRKNPAYFNEFVLGPDGKLRYFWPMRREAYKFVSDCIKATGGGVVPVYLCMESRSMWGSGLGWRPDEEEVEILLSENC